MSINKHNTSYLHHLFHILMPICHLPCTFDIHLDFFGLPFISFLVSLVFLFMQGYKVFKVVKSGATFGQSLLKYPEMVFIKKIYMLSIFCPEYLRKSRGISEKGSSIHGILSWKLNVSHWKNVLWHTWENQKN